MNHYFARKKVKKSLLGYFVPLISVPKVPWRPNACSVAQALKRKRGQPRAKREPDPKRGQSLPRHGVRGAPQSTFGGNPSFHPNLLSPKFFFFGTCHGQGLGLMLPFHGILEHHLLNNLLKIIQFYIIWSPQYLRCLWTFTTCHLPNPELGPALLVIFSGHVFGDSKIRVFWVFHLGG